MNRWLICVPGSRRMKCNCRGVFALTSAGCTLLLVLSLSTGVIKIRQMPAVLSHVTSGYAPTVDTATYSAVSPVVSTEEFRSQFLSWDLHNAPKVGEEVAGKEQGSYFIYRCDADQMRMCGGWADRLTGVTVGYMIANLTRRTFKAEFLNPSCDITQYLIPNRVNWSLPSSFSHADKSEYVIARHIDDNTFKHSIQTINFTQKFDPKTKYVYFMANLENMSGLLKSKLYAEELSWTRGLTPADVYAAVYKRLFKLSPRLQNRLQTILSDALPSKDDKLICIHIRMLRNSKGNLPKIWSFVANRSFSEHHKVFVMSDSQEVLDSARQQVFKDRLTTIPGPIVHVDYASGHARDVACEGLEKVILEQHVLMSCHVLVRCHSGLSVIASIVRATDQDLFCLHKEGHITPCSRNDFSTFL